MSELAFGSLTLAHPVQVTNYDLQLTNSAILNGFQLLCICILHNTCAVQWILFYAFATVNCESSAIFDRRLAVSTNKIHIYLCFECIFFFVLFEFWTFVWHAFAVVCIPYSIKYLLIVLVWKMPVMLTAHSMEFCPLTVHVDVSYRGVTHGKTNVEARSTGAVRLFTVYCSHAEHCHWMHRYNLHMITIIACRLTV